MPLLTMWRLNKMLERQDVLVVSVKVLLHNAGAADNDTLARS